MDESVEVSWPPTPEMTAGLVGHGQGEAVLAQALSSGRLPHAWLISGPKGIGKATLACRFGRYLLAMEGTDGLGEPDMFARSSDAQDNGGAAGKSLDVPQSAPIFGRIAAGGHGDIKIIRRSPDPKTGKMRKEIVVDDVRAAGQFLHKTSAEGGYRVIIIDCADEMNRNAANALLKSLEEPPPKTVIVLVSHAPGRLLPTIRSRCRQLPLQALCREDFGAVMGPLLALEGAPMIDEEDRDQLFHLSDGAPGVAIALGQAGGIDLYYEMIFVLESLSKGHMDVDALHKLAGKCARGEKGETFFETFSTLLLFQIARMIRQGGARTSETDLGVSPDISPGEAALLERFLAKDSRPQALLATLDHWARVWEKLTQLFAQTKGLNLDRKQVVLDAFYQINKAFLENQQCPKKTR